MVHRHSQRLRVENGDTRARLRWLHRQDFGAVGREATREWVPDLDADEREVSRARVHVGRRVEVVLHHPVDVVPLLPVVEHQVQMPPPLDREVRAADKATTVKYYMSLRRHFGWLSPKAAPRAWGARRELALLFFLFFLFSFFFLFIIFPFLFYIFSLFIHKRFSVFLLYFFLFIYISFLILFFLFHFFFLSFYSFLFYFLFHFYFSFPFLYSFFTF
jgi:hypothetical protein